SFGGKTPGDPGLTKENTLIGGGAPTGHALHGSPVFPIGQLMLHGVFDRFPDLKIYFAESHAGWLPFTMNWIDQFYLQWYTYQDFRLKKMPSEYYRDHCRFSFIVDRLAMKYRYDIGL